MKPTLPVLTSVILFLFACKKDETTAPPTAETPVQKFVEFHVFAAKDYSGPIYQNVKVDLKLQILKTNLATGQQTVVWDSTFSTRKLTDFQPIDNPLVIKKFAPVLELQEKLTGAFSIIYDDQGLIKQVASYDEAGKGESSVILQADL